MTARVGQHNHERMEPRRLVYWSFVLAVLAGCVRHRHLRLPATADVVAVTSAAPLHDQTWQVGEVSTRAEAAPRLLVEEAPYLLVTDQLQGQLTDRIRSTLASQRALGAVEGPARYVLDVELVARETYGTGPELGLAFGFQTGILVAGMVSGLGPARSAYLADVLPRLSRRVRLADVPALMPAAWARARPPR
jgi:hypothetical protein